MRTTKIFRDFFSSEKAGGLILILATVFSLILANSPLEKVYLSFWNFKFGNYSVTYWINDGLMALFFFMIGLELERELYRGELSDIKNALFPVFAAIGGMLIPALLYFFINFGTDNLPGMGIPMATDIAFSIGILSLLGKQAPSSLKIFLTAFAVIDDLGAIIIIAVFYTSTLSILNLFISLAVFGVLLMLNKYKINIISIYLIGGVLMWYFMWKSGVHPTIAGVLLAFAIPFSRKKTNPVSTKLLYLLHKPVAFIILPLFALANTCIPVEGGLITSIVHKISIGIIIGLVVGKPLGIWLFSFITTKLKYCTIPPDLKWSNIVGAGLLGGIGFTMSIFISLLAFDDVESVNHAKIGILIASLIAGTAGLIYLKLTLKKHPAE